MRVLVVSFVFAACMVGLAKACDVPFGPAFAIYVLGNIMAHVARWVDT